VTRRSARRAVALTATLLLSLPVAASARDMYATDARGNLLRFDSRFPGVLTDSVRVTGLAPGASLVGIDFRPSTGDLVGVGSDSRVYAIDVDTGAARALGAPFSPPLSGTAFGVEVDPVADLLRVVSDTGQNIRLDLTTGAPAGTFPTLNPGAPHVVALGVSNSSFSAVRPTSSTTVAIDSVADQVLVVGPSLPGTLSQGKALGIDVGDSVGLDISFIPGVGDVAYMVATPAGASGASLYRVSLVTGLAFRFGPVGTGSPLGGQPRLNLTGFAVRQAFAGPGRNIPPDVRIIPSTTRIRPGKAVVYVAYATDHDGGVERVQWDTDNDGSFDDGGGERLRRAFPAGTRTLRVRVTDNSGGRTTDTLKITVRR
jgi:hypothetical protein